MTHDAAGRITVLLADDHALFRSGVRAILDTQPDLDCVAEVGDGEAAVRRTLELRPDVAVLDVQMPRMDGLGAAAAIVASELVRTRVVLLTTHDSDEYVRTGLAAGVHGFALKSLAPEELLTAIRVVARGDVSIDPSILRRHVHLFTATQRPSALPPSFDLLTDREREVLRLLAAGSANAEIGRDLFVGEETVKTHVSSILRKLHVRDRTQAVSLAWSSGFAADDGSDA